MSAAAEELLESLTEPQRDAVTHVDGPLLVLAGPGSGKTRVITHRAAWIAATVTQPWHVLAITFTNKAAREMAERTERLAPASGITCCTFHSLCARLLRMYADRAGLERGFSIFDEADQLAVIRTAMGSEQLSADNYPPGGMLDLISRAKNDMISAEQLEQRGGFQDRAAARIYRAYQAELARQNAVDFDDLLLRAVVMLRDCSDLRDQLEERYQYVLVDEYQDTNHAQYMLARLLTQRRENLCVTGDPDQSIYSWRGASLHNILQFDEDFPNARVVRLEQNYRSTPQILAGADALIANNRRRKHKRLWTVNPAGGGITVAECEDPRVEAAYIADEIQRHVQAGGRFGDVAVFYRVNWLSRNLEAALVAANVPYQVARGVAFYQRREIKDVLAYLKLACNPHDRVSLERIINVPARGLGKVTVQRLLAEADRTGRTPLEVLADPAAIPRTRRALSGLQDFAGIMQGLSEAVQAGSAEDAIALVLGRTGLAGTWSTGPDEDTGATVRELQAAAVEYDTQHPDGSGSVADWLAQTSLVSDVDAVDEQRGAVTLMTLHSAKGLEFNNVFIAGLEEGLLPHLRSERQEPDVEEERRLLFVGMTRARRALTLTFARWREFRGGLERKSRSRFLRELPRESVNWTRIGDSGDHPARADEDFEEPVSCAVWREGQFVRHAEYGVGRVLALDPPAQPVSAVIQFRHGPVSFRLAFAPLQPIEPDEVDDDGNLASD